MGAVFRAHDRARGHDVALKVLPELDATALLRFKNEFRALHDIQHENLVRLYELHEEQGTWFFTMQLVEGSELLAWIDGDERRLRAVMPQIARALHRLHGDGLVHRDVKPSNVLVTQTGIAMLLDFGLVAPTWSPGEGAGTPAYMAPEQVSGDVSPATDWYVVGVLLFRVLTGTLPFVGAAEEVMDQKTRAAAPRVRDLAPSAPRDLAELADALLARRPQDRPSGEAVLAALGARPEPRRHAREILVGRDAELAALRGALAAREAGESFAIAVVGESGLGKTTLLRAFAQEVEASGAWVLGGRCWERESVPYKGVDGVIDELVARLDAESTVLAPSPWAPVLAQAFPVLRRLPAFASVAPFDVAAEAPEARESLRVSGAVRGLLAEIARDHPLVVVVDDLQWADRDALAVLRGLVEPALDGVTVIVGAREPVELGAHVPTRVIALALLSEVDTALLVDLVARELGGEIDRAAIAREAAGHPLFAAELARHAVVTGESSRIAFDDAVLQIAERAGPEARQVATIVSLAFAPITADAIAHVARHAVIETIASLRDAQIVASTGVGAGQRFEPAHDRIRAAFTTPLHEDDLVALHGRIADALEATRFEDHAALALHCVHARRPQLAARHALRAAEQAEAALAYHRAARLYTWVVELDPSLPGVRLRQAGALAQASLGVAAAEAFLACARESRGAEAIDLRRRAMQQLLQMGHTQRALQLLDELVRWLRLPNPTTPGRMLLAIVGRRASIRVRRPALLPPSASEADPLERARLDVTWDAASGLAFLDPLRSYYFHSMNLDMSFRAGDPTRLARALMSEAPYLAASGKHSRRLATILELVAKASARAGFPALEPLTHGVVAFFFGRWRECRDALAPCERMLLADRPRLVREGFGPVQLLDITRRLQLVATLYLGELRTTTERVAELLADAVERNDVASATHLRTGVQALLHLARADVEAAQRHADAGFHPWRESRTGIPHVMDVQAQAAIEMYTGRGDAAHRRVVGAWSRFADARLFRAQYIHVSLLDVRGRAALAAAALAPEARRGELIADARHCADKLRAEQAVWSLPLATSLRAGIALAQRRDADARSELERAAAGFDAADMRIHAATVRMTSAMLASRLDTQAAQRHVLAEAGVVEIERFSKLLFPH